MPQHNGGDLLVALLRDLGVDTVFGVVSVHNLPLVEATGRDLRFVPVRHEATAVNAADGHGRARGGIGCALTSTGTGAGNAAGSLIESLATGSRVLHVTGQIDSRHLGAGRGYIHETRDQLGMLRAVSAHAATVPDAARAARVLRDAADHLLGPAGGPASVEWPIDLQYAPQDPAALPAARPTPAPVRPAPDALDAAADALAAARRPLVWAGGGATTAGPELAALLDRTGAGLLTSNSGRGAIPETDDRCIGNFATTPTGRALLADADLLLTVGTHFRSNESADWSLELPAVHLQIDHDPAALGRAYPAAHPLHGDAATTLAALRDRLTARPAPGPDPAWTVRVREARETVRAELRDRIGPQAALCDAIRAALPPQAVLARDVTVPASSWGNRLLDIHHPHTNVFPRGGGIGQGPAWASAPPSPPRTRPPSSWPATVASPSTSANSSPSPRNAPA